MNDEQRQRLQPIFDSLDPKSSGIMPFPPAGDDGEGEGDDKDLASIIFYGAEQEINEDIIAFAIKLGRTLQASSQVPLWLLFAEAGRRHVHNGSGLSEYQIPNRTWEEFARVIESGKAEKALVSRESPLAHYLPRP